MNTKNVSGIFCKDIKATSKWREWLGWFGSMAWMYCVINGYMYLSNDNHETIIYWYLVAFLAVFALAVAAISFRFGRDPNGLSRVAFYMTPVAIVITALFSFLPHPLGSVLFALSPIFIAPALVRRAYGIVRAASSKHTLLAYMSGIYAGFLLMQLSYYLEWPTEMMYILYAVPPIFAWLGVRRSIEFTNHAPGELKRGLSKPLLFGIAAAFIVMFWLGILSNLINEALAPYFNEYLYFPVYVALPPAIGLLYAFISDKGRERTGIIVGLGVLFISVQLALLAGDPQNKLAIPLMFSNRLFHEYNLYISLTIPLYFFTQVKRPVVAAALGIEFYLIRWLIGRIILPLIPDVLRSGTPLFVATAITSLAFFILLHFIFERRREKTLAAALYAMLQNNLEVSTLPTDTTLTSGITEPPETAEKSMADAGFTQEEIEVALLLIEGNARSEITRKLRLSASDANIRMRSIRDKISGIGDPDPVITAVVKKYRLTGRETNMLRYLRDGLTNVQIASELVISEETVKGHVRNLMRKLPVDDRHMIPVWLKEFETEAK